MIENLIKVVLLFEDALVLDSVSKLLSAQPDVEIIGVARATADALKLVELQEPDVLLMDTPLPDADVFDIIGQLQARPKPPAILIVSTYHEPSGVAALMNAGVLGYCTRCDEPHPLPYAVRAVAAGLPCCSPTMQRRLMDWITAHVKPIINHDLSAREVEVLHCLAQDQTDAQIAESLHLTKNTIQFHLKNIYAKLGVHTRVGAAMWAANNLPPSE